MAPEDKSYVWQAFHAKSLNAPVQDQYSKDQFKLLLKAYAIVQAGRHHFTARNFMLECNPVKFVSNSSLVASPALARPQIPGGLGGSPLGQGQGFAGGYPTDQRPQEAGLHSLGQRTPSTLAQGDTVSRGSYSSQPDTQAHAAKAAENDPRVNKLIQLIFSGKGLDRTILAEFVVNLDQTKDGLILGAPMFEKLKELKKAVPDINQRTRDNIKYYQNRSQTESQTQTNVMTFTPESRLDLQDCFKFLQVIIDPHQTLQSLEQVLRPKPAAVVQPASKPEPETTANPKFRATLANLGADLEYLQTVHGSQLENKKKQVGRGDAAEQTAGDESRAERAARRAGVAAAGTRGSARPAGGRGGRAAAGRPRARPGSRGLRGRVRPRRANRPRARQRARGTTARPNEFE